MAVFAMPRDATIAELLPSLDLHAQGEAGALKELRVRCSTWFTCTDEPSNMLRIPGRAVDGHFDSLYRQEMHNVK